MTDFAFNSPAGSLISQSVKDCGLVGLRGWMVSTRDGRALVGSVESDVGGAAAVLASSYALGERIAEFLGESSIRESIVRTNDGVVASYAIGDQGVLTLMVANGSNLAQIAHSARRLIDPIARVFKELERNAPHTSEVGNY